MPDVGFKLSRGATIVPAKEFLLNLYRDLIQPSLSPVCPVLVMPDRCLKFSYPVFSGAKLSRQLVSHFDGVLVICLSVTRRPVEQPQDCLACPVKWIARFRPDVRFWCKRNDCVVRRLSGAPIESRHLVFHLLGELAHSVETKRPIEPDRTALEEPLHVLPADQREKLTEFLAVGIEQQVAMPDLLRGHFVVHRRRVRVGGALAEHLFHHLDLN
jgi:hypothetical protein